MSSSDQKEHAGLKSLLAGMASGAVEVSITYPTEYVKTRLQLASRDNTNSFKGPIDCLRTSVKERGITSIYRGLTPLIVGTALKAGIRFFSYEEYKRFMESAFKGPCFMAALLAGMTAGITEGILVVTPTETIKTKLIEDFIREQSRFKGMIHGVVTISKDEGLSGLYRGVFPVIARQAANSSIRFSVYEFLKSNADRVYGGKEEGRFVDTWRNFINGALAGMINVFLTMPIDVVKTKMQSLDASKLYKNSFECASSIVRNDGIIYLWKGVTPRLGRLSVSGGIIFSIYEQTLNLLDVVWN